MSNRLLTDNILNQVKAMAGVPVSQGRFSDANLLLMLKDVVDTIIFPMIIKARSNHNEVRETVTSDSDGVITIPTRSYLNGFTKLKNTSNEIFLNEVPESANENSYESYYFLGDQVIVTPQSQDFEMTYTQRPPQFQLESVSPKVVSFNPTTRQVEVDVATFESDMDIVKANGYTRATNIGRTSTVSSTVFILAGTAVPVVGEYITEAETSPLLPIPQEVVGYVTRILCSRILQDIPDPEGLKVSMEIESVMRENVLEVLKPRGRRASVMAKKPFINNNYRYRRSV